MAAIYVLYISIYHIPLVNVSIAADFRTTVR